jgi:hypothetical protein
MIEEVINSMKLGKACGPDNLSVAPEILARGFTYTFKIIVPNHLRA